jgi:hypothetical protein
MTKTNNRSSRRRHHPWRSILLYSSLAWGYSHHPGAAAFQASSKFLQARSILSSSPSTSSHPLQASRVSFGNEQSPESSSRTWNVQRRKTVNNNNNKLAPILPNGSSLHTTTTSEQQQSPGRKKMKPMPVTGYDAQSILDFYDRRPLQVGWRLNSLGFPLLGWYMGLLTDKALGIAEKPNVQRKRGEELRQLLVRSQSVALVKVSDI